MGKWLIKIVFLAGIGFLIILLVQWVLPNNTHYVDINHAQAGDQRGNGSLAQPWKTLEYAIQQLRPGDTLIVRGGVYPGVHLRLDQRHSGREQAPITLKAYPGETVIWRSPHKTKLIFAGAEWWTIEGLIFEGQIIQIGTDLEHISRHIRLRSCLFRDSHSNALEIWYAQEIVIEDCHFQRIQSQTAGADVSAVVIAYQANNILIRHSKFEDISSDGIHLKQNIHLANITIEASEFWINNPDQVFLGENGIDVKKVDGPIYIRDNVIHGFRPTVAGQNASGANGVGVILHNDAQNVVVERNLFYDNTIHVGVTLGTQGTLGGTRDIIIRNNIFRDAHVSNRSGQPEGGFALLVGKAQQIQVYHNTFVDNDFFLRSYQVISCTFKNNIIIGGQAGIHKSNAIWLADSNAWSQLEQQIPPNLRGQNDLVAGDLKLTVDLYPQSDSPIIDAGIKFDLIDDYTGRARNDQAPDLGAFEYIP